MTDREKAIEILQRIADDKTEELHICDDEGGSVCGLILDEQNAILAGIEALKEQRPHGEWIPIRWADEETKCKLREYPFDGKWVIVTDGKNISVERIKIDALDHFSPAGRWFELEDVVAWMPLPEPYLEEGESE